MLHKKCKYSKNIEYISTPCAPPLGSGGIEFALGSREATLWMVFKLVKINYVMMRLPDWTVFVRVDPSVS